MRARIPRCVSSCWPIVPNAPRISPPWAGSCETRSRALAVRSGDRVGGLLEISTSFRRAQPCRGRR
jgi:hypothetical protein